MESNDQDQTSKDQNQILRDFSPYLIIYNDGRVERLKGTNIIPPSLDDPKTGVSSKDVVIFPDSGVSARIYLPKLSHPNQKLPVLVYYHGGAFCIESAFSPTYQTYLNTLAAAANILVVSVDYRRVPEHPLPTAYDDSWATLKWVASHKAEDPNSAVCEAWLKDHADLTQIFVGGDSAGANIAHHMTLGRDGQGHVGIVGALLLHPYFWGVEAVGEEPRDPAKRAKADAVWMFACPTSSGCDDPWINPVAAGASSLVGLRCKRVLVCVAAKDVLRERGRLYYECLCSSGWEGEAEFDETEGEEHVFHLFKPESENAHLLMKRVVDFFVKGSGVC